MFPGRGNLFASSGYFCLPRDWVYLLTCQNWFFAAACPSYLDSSCSNNHFLKGDALWFCHQLELPPFWSLLYFDENMLILNLFSFEFSKVALHGKIDSQWNDTASDACLFAHLHFPEILWISILVQSLASGILPALPGSCLFLLLISVSLFLVYECSKSFQSRWLGRIHEVFHSHQWFYRLDFKRFFSFDDIFDQ